MTTSSAPRLILTHGLPGAGKDTWAAQEAREHGYRVVNRDAIRTELFGAKYHLSAPQQKAESAVTAEAHERYRAAFRAQETVISSDTNLNPRLLPQLIALARSYGAAIEQVYFDVPLAVCIKRNAKRARKGGREVAREVIENMASKAYFEGHIKEFVIGDGEVFAVPMVTPGMRVIADFDGRAQARYPLETKDVLILDLDGSLANNLHAADQAFGKGKSKNFSLMYELTALAEANREVLALAHRARAGGLMVFVLSGAPDSYAADIIRFLERVDAPVSRLLLRRDGDHRPDTLVKAEIFRQLAQEGFTVVHAVDDRAKVLSMWRSLGVLTSSLEEHEPLFTGEAVVHPDPALNTFLGEGFCARCGLELPVGEFIHAECRS